MKAEIARLKTDHDRFEKDKEKERKLAQLNWKKKEEKHLKKIEDLEYQMNLIKSESDVVNSQHGKMQKEIKQLKVEKKDLLQNLRQRSGEVERLDREVST